MDSQYRFVKGNLDAIVLSCLNDGGKSGYSVMRDISKRHGVLFGSNAIYHLLKQMEQSGLVEGRIDTKTGRPRKVYKLTKAGLDEERNLGYRLIYFGLYLEGCFTAPEEAAKNSNAYMKRMQNL